MKKRGTWLSIETCKQRKKRRKRNGKGEEALNFEEVCFLSMWIMLKLYPGLFSTKFLP